MRVLLLGPYAALPVSAGNRGGVLVCVLGGHCRLPRKRMRGLCALARRSEGSIVVSVVVVADRE